MPLPEERGRHGDGRPKVHRFRSHWLELGVRLRAFRERYGLTQSEVARVLAVTSPAVCQWEAGVAVAQGLPRERLTDLLGGSLWPELRAALIEGDGLPRSWNEAVRWYRRASRERTSRESAGALVAAILDDLRAVDSPEALRQCYIERDGEWAHALANQCGLGDHCRTDVRSIEDAAHGLCWLEVAHGLHFDLGRSLVPQVPLALLDAE